MTEYISRKDLGWPASKAPLKAHATKGVKIHYEGTSVPVQDHSHCKAHWTSVRNSHLANRKENYSDVAYNFAVCRHGAVLEGRGLGRRTGANGNQTLNANHDAVVVLYGTNDKSVSPEVIDGLKWVIRYLREHSTGLEIKGHRDGYATACPGDPLYALVRDGSLEPGKATAPAVKYEPFPGRAFFRIGRVSKRITALGRALEKAGYKGYKFGPGSLFTKQDLAAVKWFQKKQGWSGADADGYPGSETWKRLKIPKL